MKINRPALFILLIAMPLLAQYNPDPPVLAPEMLRMPREEIRFNDNQLRLFNGRGCIYPRRYSLTGLHRIQFPPLDLQHYSFHLDFEDTASGVLIRDDVPALWEEWTRHGTGTDPLGANFRPGFATVLVSQDEYWEPNRYVREGTFHKQYGERWVSFAIKTETLVSGERDEVFLKVTLTNRSGDDLILHVLPRQLVKEPSPGMAPFEAADGFTIANGVWQISVASGLEKRDQDGWIWEIAAGRQEVACFAVISYSAETARPSLLQADIGVRLSAAARRTAQRLHQAASKLPQIRTENARLDEFYRRCIGTVMECKWERENFIINPFWSVGTWIFTITWDNSFFADMLTMMDPQSMRQTILIALQEGKMECTYVSWLGGAPGIIYIQEPFALRTMIDAYLRHTGDTGFLDEEVAGKTVLGWMKAWSAFLDEHYRSPYTGLIDMGKGTEELIEIRTDGYNYVVPVVNGLTADFNLWLSKWCVERGDADSSRFSDKGQELYRLLHQRLWNPEARWFDNLYADGGRKAVFSNHLFDLLGTSVLTPEEVLGLISHLNDNEFLGPFSTWSISRQDRVHWDLIDADWGGGGSFTGMPLRLVRDLYKRDFGTLAWTILSRFTQYVDYFPYLGQNMRANEPYQDESSMPVQVSAGAGVEAIVFGLFGITPFVDGRLDIRPFFHYDVGSSSLKNFRFRSHVYDLDVDRDGFTAYRDGRDLGSYRIGQTIRIMPDGTVSTDKDWGVAAPRVNTETHWFIREMEVGLSCDTPGARICYTRDGSDPTPESMRYEAPFRIMESQQIRARAYKHGLKASPVSELYFQKTVFRDAQHPSNIINLYPYPEIEAAFNLSEHHLTDHGLYSIMDGIYGSESYSDGQWLGVEGDDFTVTVTWPEPVPLKRIRTRFLQNLDDWIFLPEELEIGVSKDGQMFEPIYRDLPGTERDKPNFIYNAQAVLPDTITIRALRVHAVNRRTCPEWHPGAGGKAWLFVDEIVIQ